MEVYQEKEKWTMKKLAFLGIRIITIFAVALNAFMIIKLSIGNTMKFAAMLGLPPKGAMFLVEAAFALLLTLRAIQRALGLNVPILINAGYLGVFCLLTAVNVYGLYLRNPQLGPYGGLAISALMWLFENILVWLFTRSNEPYQPGILKKYFDAIKQAWEEKMIQKIYWIKYNSQRPHLDLVKKVRKAEDKRKKVIGDEELPEFFEHLKKQGDIDEIAVELERTSPKVINVDDTDVQTVQTLPARRIGFHAEDERRVQSGVQSSVQTVQPRKKADLAYEYAWDLFEQKEEVPSCREIVQYSEHIAESTGQKDLKVSVGTAKTGRDRLIEELNKN